MRLGGDVELAEERAAVRPGDSPSGVDVDAAHPGQIHDQASGTAGESGQAVSARPDGDLELVVPTEPDRRCHLGGVSRPEDGRGAAVVQGVPQAASIVVGRVGGGDDVAVERPADLIEGLSRERRGRVDHAACPPCGSRRRRR
jgi:hypothetical protein